MEEDYDDDDISSEEEGEDLILEGVLVRNPDVESSEDSDCHESDNASADDASDCSSVQEKPSKPVTSKKMKPLGKQQVDQRKETKRSPSSDPHIDANERNKKRKKSNKKDGGVEIIPVEFTFHDMDEKYFYGMKNFLLSHPMYASHSSALADLLIDNISVGTVVSTQDGEDNVFGFASVLNISRYSSNECIQDIRRICMDACPEEHRREMETVLSGKTARPAGLFIHGRMVNLPLEITHVLHEQLVQDMEWAVEHAHGGEEKRKSLDFGAFVLLAPCQRDSDHHGTVIYKNFDDEVFAECAEFVYPLNPSDWKKSPCKVGNKDLSDKSDDGDMDNNNNNKKKKQKKSRDLSLASTGSSQNDDKGFVHVIVLTRTGHQKAMKQLNQLIHGGG